jgi:uncharacterized protein (DUF1778 family)
MGLHKLEGDVRITECTILSLIERAIVRTMYVINEVRTMYVVRVNNRVNTMATSKDSRIYLRASAEQAALIRRAAQAQRKSTSEFVLDSACRSAENALYDLRTIQLDERGWDQLTTALDREAREIPELVELFKEKAPWD